MKSSPFQIILIAVFSFFIVVALIALYFTKSSGKEEKEAVEVSLWGTLSSYQVEALSAGAGLEKSGIKIVYQEIKSDNFDEVLIEALASGTGPDAILISTDRLLRYQDKIYPFSYESITERNFKDTYVSATELFMSPWGYLGIPLAIDPLVMYWNRDIFSNAGMVYPPKVWNDFLRLAETLTEKGDNQSSIKRSAVALGEFGNVDNAKEIISAMALQAGTPLVKRSAEGALFTDFGDGTAFSGVIDFYTEFANPVKPDYTWNRSLPNSQAMFVRGDLGIYFGFGSEFGDIKRKNPNLDFDIAYFPQPKNAKTNITFGRIYGISILKWSANKEIASVMAGLLGGKGAGEAWIAISGLPSARRDMVSAGPKDAFSTIIFNSALWARSWLDPDAKKTKTLFGDMIDSITSGWMTTGQAIGVFKSKLGLLIGR